MIRLVLACLVLLPALVPAARPAGATSEGTQAIRNWGAMDRCTREAQQAFPDYSAEAYAKRDAHLRNCLAGHHLPPREPATPGH